MFFNVEKAIKLQSMLSQRVLGKLDYSPPLGIDRVRYIAGFDSAYSGNRQCAAVVVYDTENSRVVDRAYSIVEIHVPYIPGLLAFREIPGYMRAYSRIKIKPDILLVDGHGLSHPRAFGIASHLGLVLDKPSIGVAKSHLYGEIIKRNELELIHAHGRVVGAVMRHRDIRLYVSIGYKIKLEEAITVVKKLLVKDMKLPIPLQEADRYSKIIKNKYCR